MADGGGASRGTGVLIIALGTAFGAGACGDVLSEPGEQHVQVRAGDCYSCHQPDYENAANPPHVNAMPTVCAACHSQSAWAPATFAHSWPIAGAHTKLACQTCHTGAPPKYQGTPTECVGCHQQDYDTSVYPGHNTFPTACATCHSQEAWKPAAFNHKWPILGAHTKVACQSCHTGNPPKYLGTPTLCVGCHQKDYDSSPHPGHNTYPTTCDSCHSQLGWKPASTVAHPFPLDGAHATTPCASCHVGNPAVYKGTPKDCYSCHTDDFNSSPYPGHSGFSHTCSGCHSTTAWKPATGGSHPENKFPINSGKHKNIKCADCHDASLGPTSKANTACVSSCHTSAEMNNVHKGENKYPTGTSSLNFCLDCHSDGSK